VIGEDGGVGRFGMRTGRGGGEGLYAEDDELGWTGGWMGGGGALPLSRDVFLCTSSFLSTYKTLDNRHPTINHTLPTCFLSDVVDPVKSSLGDFSLIASSASTLTMGDSRSFTAKNST
jgi:hypothetical protein